MLPQPTQGVSVGGTPCIVSTQQVTLDVARLGEQRWLVCIGDTAPGTSAMQRPADSCLRSLQATQGCDTIAVYDTIHTLKAA